MNTCGAGEGGLKRALRFYRDGLGLTTDGIVREEFEYGAVAFFGLQTGLRLAIWPRESIAHDSGLPVTDPAPAAFTIGHNVSSESKVDEVLAQAAATMVKPGHATFWGATSMAPAGQLPEADRNLQYLPTDGA